MSVGVTFGMRTDSMGSLARLELFFWIGLAALSLVRIYYAVAWEGIAPYEALRLYLDHAIIAFFLVVVPVLHRLVFEQLPLEYMRARRRRRLYDRESFLRSIRERTEDGSVDLPSTDQPTSTSDDVRFSVAEGEKADSALQTLSSQTDAGVPQRSPAEQYLHSLAESSRTLADGFFSRSRVYLFVGVIIAFSGLVFFYAVMPNTFDSKDPTSLMVSFAPKFGVLFFIELVAFFFLRQHRATMDEFRYYEAIKRRREELLALVKTGNERGSVVDLVELVKMGHFFSLAGRLEKEETTEILEARKLEKNETAVLEKAIDAVAQARKK